MYFDELLDVFVKVNHVGNSSLELHYLIMNETQETTVTGRGRVVLVDRNTKKSVAIPIDKRSILENV
jgi:acyl-CoA thioester hydrolase